MMISGCGACPSRGCRRRHDFGCRLVTDVVRVLRATKVKTGDRISRLQKELAACPLPS